MPLVVRTKAPKTIVIQFDRDFFAQHPQWSSAEIVAQMRVLLNPSGILDITILEAALQKYGEVRADLKETVAKTQAHKVALDAARQILDGMAAFIDVEHSPNSQPFQPS